MVSCKKTLFVVAVLCVASLLLFHFPLSMIIHSVHSITVDNAFLRSEGLSVALEARSPNVTNWEYVPDGQGTAVERLAPITVGALKPAVKATVPAVKATIPVVKATVPVVKATVPVVKATVPAPQGKHGCDCNKSDYHVVSMDEFKSLFSRHRNGGGAAFLTAGKFINDSYTIVIPSYKRDNAIPMQLDHFCKARHVHKILFLWQNTGHPIPSRFVGLKCEVPYKFITPKKNSLSNRFILYEEIETEAVFTIDDDTLESHEMLSAGFEVWKSYPHLMVGYISRTHSVVDGRYHYYDGLQCYSMILTTAAFLHRKYLEVYWSPEMAKLREFVDQNMNGEDIVMNGVVSNYLRHSGIDLTPACHSILIGGGRKDLRIPGAGYLGVFARPGHQQKRDKCVNLVADFFGTLPFTCCQYQIKKPLKADKKS